MESGSPDFFNHIPSLLKQYVSFLWETDWDFSCELKLITVLSVISPTILTQEVAGAQLSLKVPHGKLIPLNTLTDCLSAPQSA